MLTVTDSENLTAVRWPQFICQSETRCLDRTLRVLDPDNSQGFAKIVINDLLALTWRALTRHLFLRALWYYPSVQCSNDIGERRSSDFCIGKERRRWRYFVALIRALSSREFLNTSP